MRNAKGIRLEVGGSIKNDGLILTDRDASVNIKVAKNYSGKGSIIQTDSGKKRWFSMDNPIVWVMASIVLIILVAVVWYLSDKVGLPLKFGSI